MKNKKKKADLSYRKHLEIEVKVQGVSKRIGEKETGALNMDYRCGEIDR